MTGIITGEKIKAIRHKTGLTQVKFACEVGISQSSLSHVPSLSLPTAENITQPT